MKISTSLKTLPLVPISIGRGQEMGTVKRGEGGESTGRENCMGKKPDSNGCGKGL